jgi:energy-coupling factor transporter ATP-binding protein EcfA2
MPTKALRTHSLAIERLKGIRGLDEISFEDKPLTGIFGPNGIGKSTILQALAAAYSAPTDCDEAPHYKQFFPPLATDIWNGTKFFIDHSYTTGTTEARGQIEYRKGTVNTQWTPTVNRRPERHVTYVGVKSCVPDLEAYRSNDLTGSTSTPVTDAVYTRVRETMGGILNCTYTAMATVSIAEEPRKQYISLTRQDIGGVEYPSVVMGAGEQRLIRLLHAVEKTRTNGLVLIDEFDLLLHGDALKKLVDYLIKRCTDRKLQIVFTSHREELLDLKDQINIRHLWPLGGKHYCYPNTNADSLHRLTGRRVRDLEIFVEDDVADAIASHVARELGMSRNVQIIRFGAATNCFTVLAGLLMKGDRCNKSLFVLDGDVYLNPDEREKQIERACSGNDATATARRAAMPGHIKDFVLPAGMKPEQYLHSLICTLPSESLQPEELEIQNAAREIVNPPDRHGFIYHLVKTLGDDRAVQLARVIPLAAKHPDWANYTQPVREWLMARRTALHL